jgi:hypothetical protein
MSNKLVTNIYIKKEIIGKQKLSYICKCLITLRLIYFYFPFFYSLSNVPATKDNPVSIVFTGFFII